jgi:RNA polymerase sigma-70 factor (ECF subfamily)
MVAIMAEAFEPRAYGDRGRGPARPEPCDDLVVLAKTEAEALGRLYERYYDRILRFCIHRLFNRTTAEDITSSVFLTVARTIRGFQGRTEQDFRSWIYAIAVNQANAHIRKTLRRRRLLDHAVNRRAGDEDPAAAWSRLDWPTLYAAMGQLKPPQQTLLTLRFFENMDYDEIGRVMGVRPATVRVMLHRTLRRLQEVLRGDLGIDQ